MSVAIQVCIEQGSKKVFASALEWPGWSRSGKTEEEALEALADHAERYSPVPALAGLELARRAGDELEVVERVKGDGATDFGVPHIPAEYEYAAVDAKAAKRSAGLVTASWDFLDQVAGKAPATLQKGPRGGGRDRDPIVDHVLTAEVSYAAKLGVKAKDDPSALRPRIIEVLAAPSPAKRRDEKGWPARYVARRIAWHALDHAWEIEDKS